MAKLLLKLPVDKINTVSVKWILTIMLTDIWPCWIRILNLQQWPSGLKKRLLCQVYRANGLFFGRSSLMENHCFTPTALPDDYFKHFAYSNLVRIGRGAVDATILAENSTLFTLFNENSVLQAVRMASAFFGKGQFIADHLQIIDGAIVLQQELNGPYYQPYPISELPGDGDWEKMPRKNRPKSEIQYLRSTVKIEEKNRGEFALTFDIQGTDHIPLAIELGFRSGGEFSGVKKVLGIDDAWFLESAKGRYQFDGHNIEFGSGHHTHQWTQLRGASPKLNGMSVYLTGFTPFKFTPEISAT